MSSLKQGTPMTYSIRQRSELSSESFQIFCMFNIWIKAAELMFLLLEKPVLSADVTLQEKQFPPLGLSHVPG